MKNVLKWSLLLFATHFILPGCNKDKDDISSPGFPLHSGYMPSVNKMKLTYTITEGSESGFSTVITVNNVHDSADYTIAESDASVSGLTFKDFSKFNLKNTIIFTSEALEYNQFLEALKPQYNVSFTHSERPFTMTIPHQDQMNSVVFPEVVTGEFHGVNKDEDVTTKGDYSVTQNEGKIDTLEKIRIKPGEFDCVRVHWKKVSHTKVVITDDSGPSTMDDITEFDETSWLTRGLGVIKTIEINLKTGEKSTTELTKIEK